MRVLFRKKLWDGNCGERKADEDLRETDELNHWSVKATGWSGRIKAVSYTHLDVYKRQVMPDCSRLF